MFFGNNFYKLLSLKTNDINSNDVEPDICRSGEDVPINQDIEPFEVSTQAIPSTLEEFFRIAPDCACLIKRDDLLEKIIKCLEIGKRFIVVYGQTMTGKTSILKRLSEKIDKSQYLPLMVTAQALSLDAQGNCDKFAFELANQLTRPFRKWAKKHGLLMIEFPKETDFKEGEKGFYEHWDKILKIANETKPLVIIDEIEQLIDGSEEPDQRVLRFFKDFRY